MVRGSPRNTVIVAQETTPTARDITGRCSSVTTDHVSQVSYHYVDVTGTRSKIFNETVLKDNHLLTLHEKCTVLYTV